MVVGKLGGTEVQSREHFVTGYAVEKGEVFA
jgi:hypothetical protein